MKKVLSFVLSFMLVLSFMPGTMISFAEDGVEYEVVKVLTGNNTDFSTTLSTSGSNLAGGNYTLQNLAGCNPFSKLEKNEIDTSIASGITSDKVISLNPTGTGNPQFRFKGFTASPINEPIRVKFRIYIANKEGSSGTYKVTVLPQSGTSASSAGGEFTVSGIPAGEWYEINKVTTPNKSGVANVRGIKVTIAGESSNFPANVYLDGNIVVEQLKKKLTPDELLAEDKNALDLGDLSAVEEDIELPTSGSVNKSIIKWKSSDETVVKDNGEIIIATEDRKATLTATLSLAGATSVTKKFEVTVKAQPLEDVEAQNSVDLDKEALVLGDTSAVTENLILPKVGENGSTITWETSKASVVENDGTIHRSKDDGEAILTATITCGSKSETKTFPITVKADTDRYQVSWYNIYNENFAGWTLNKDEAKLGYPYRFGASNTDRMEFRHTGTAESQGNYPELVYEVTSVSKDAMIAAHPGTTSGATGSGNYAKIYRESNVGHLYFRLKEATSVAVGDKVRTTFRIFPTDICLTGKITESNGDLDYDELDTVKTITYTVQNNYATKATSTSSGGYSKEITLIPNQWNEVTLEYTATKAGVGGFEFPLGYAKYSPESYNTPFPATIYIDGDIKIEQGLVEDVAEKALADLEAIDLGNLNAVANNLVLPAKGSVYGLTIDWTTSASDVVEADGTIHPGTEPKTATLTATIKYGSESQSRTFPVTVAGEETDAEKVAIDKAALDLGDISAVTKDLTLPLVGTERQSTITWATSNATVVEANGKIHPAEDSKTETLTATITNGNASDTKEFTVTVKGTVEKRTLKGVSGTYFYGGEFVEKNRIYFDSIFEGDGANGTNGTQVFEPNPDATEDKNKYIGLVAEKTDDKGIKFKGWVPDSYPGVKKLLLSKTYDLPEMKNLAQPYYVELEVDSLTRGVVTYNFGNGNGNVLSIQKTDSLKQVEGIWKDVPEQEDYVFYIDGVEKARTDVVRKKVTTFGIYVIPEIKKIVIYQDGELLTSQVFDYTGEDTVLKDVTVTWTQTQGSAGIPASSYLHLRSMILFEGPALSEEDCLALDKEYFRFSIATDEPFNAISKPLTLPANAVFGSEVKWSVSYEDSLYLDPTTGAINQDEKLNKTVTLYAEIGPEGNSVTKEQEFTILATTPSVVLDGVDGTSFYENTFYQKEKIQFGDLFEDSTVNSDGWASNGTNGTVYVAPITTEDASEGEKTPGLYAKKTEDNGIWYQSLVSSAENNGQGLPIFEKMYYLPEIEDPGLPYYIELDAEMYIRDSLTLSFGKRDNGVVEIEKLDQNEHADHAAGKNIFAIRTNNVERGTFPYTYEANTERSAVKIGIQVIPELKQVLVYKNGELMYSEPLDFSKKSTPLTTLTIKWEHSTVRTTLMKENYLHLKSLTLYEGSPLPDADRLALDLESLQLTSITDEMANQITKDLNLIDKGVFGSNITWSVKDNMEYVIDPETGTVTRQENAENVTLVATLFVDENGDKKTKEFTVTVVKKGTEGNLVVGSEVKEENKNIIGDPSNIADGIFETYVETLKPGKASFTIDLGEEKLLSKVIIYERMLDGQYNIKSAILKLSTDGVTEKKVAEFATGVGANKVAEFNPQPARYIIFSVTGVDSGKTVSLYEIEAIMSTEPSTIVDADISVLKAFDAYNVTESITLPTEGQLGSTIVWTSSNTNIIDNTGNVTRPSGSGANVTLTATVTYNGVTKTVSFNHYVEGLTAGGAGGSGGSGGGGGGSSDDGNDKVTGGGAMNETPVQPGTPIAPESGIFNDVKETDWAYSYIEKLYTEKIMEGDGKGNFDPKRPIKREEFLKILLLSLNVEIEENGDSVFSDVNSNDWYAPFVNTAYKLGITNGMGDGSFGVGQTISRQDMAVLANRVAALKGVELTAKGEKKLTDINSVSDYAKESVQILANAGIISGDEYAIFNPEGNALREQAAKIICMIMELK